MGKKSPVFSCSGLFLSQIRSDDVIQISVEPFIRPRELKKLQVSGQKGVLMGTKACQWAKLRISKHEDVSVGIKDILPNTYIYF